MHKIEDRVVECGQQHESVSSYVREYVVTSATWGIYHVAFVASKTSLEPRTGLIGDVRFTTSESVKPTAFVIVNTRLIHVSEHETMAHAKAKLETLTPVVIDRVKMGAAIIFQSID